jgi:N-acyl-phosphatidylethanolamine-hydrolysing phospholipase D
VKFLIKFFALAAIISVGASALYVSQSVNAHYNAAKPHHTPEGFKNNYPHGSGGSFWKWQWERISQGVAKAPEGGWQTVLPSVKPDVAFLKQNRTERTMTWLGHATVLLQTSGVNIITDPVFSERTAPVQFAGPKRQVPFMLSYDELPEIDVVFISHNHYDHLDLGTIQEFKQRFRKAQYIVPLGLKAWFDDLGVDNVRELDWWDVARIGNITYTFVPAQHWSKRSLSDTNRSLWGGIVIEDATNSRGDVNASSAAPWRFMYTGDTGYSQDFKDIAAKFPQGFDWAAIPIGAYEPRWFMKAQHVNPDESVQIMKDLGARQSLAVHWGTWMLTDEALDLPPKDLAVALNKHGVDPARFHVFKNGEMRRL